MQIHFGEREWTLPDSVAASNIRCLPAIDDLRESIDVALSAPLDFSSLDQAIIPGDIVALAIDPTVPSLPALVTGIVQWLVEHGTDPNNLRLVLAANCGRADSLRGNLQQSGLGFVSVEMHDPDDMQQLSYVAANESAEPIYINRTLVDADVVIPIICSRSAEALDYFGPFGIFPLFSNREMLGKLRNYARLSQDAQRKTISIQTREAAWHLGLLVAVQIIPSSDDQPAAILCGTLDKVEQTAQGGLLQARRSELNPDDKVDLVIAVLDGVDQDWVQVARALHHANGICDLGGSIVLCTDLRQPIGTGLRRLRGAHTDREQVAKRLSRDCSDDALAASVILDSTRDHHVYLVSSHSQQSIEDLGLGVLTDARQLSSLISHHTRSVVLFTAQHP